MFNQEKIDEYLEILKDYINEQKKLNKDNYRVLGTEALICEHNIIQENSHIMVRNKCGLEFPCLIREN